MVPRYFISYWKRSLKTVDNKANCPKNIHPLRCDDIQTKYKRKNIDMECTHVMIACS